MAAMELLALDDRRHLTRTGGDEPTAAGRRSTRRVPPKAEVPPTSAVRIHQV